MILDHLGKKLTAPASTMLKRGNFTQTLDCVDRMSVEFTQRLARLRSKHVDPVAHKKRAEHHDSQKWNQCHRQLPVECKQNCENGGRYDDRDESRRHGMGEEIFDSLYVISRHGDQITGTATH